MSIILKLLQKEVERSSRNTDSRTHMRGQRYDLRVFSKQVSEQVTDILDENKKITREDERAKDKTFVSKNTKGRAKQKSMKN